MTSLRKLSHDLPKMHSDKNKADDRRDFHPCARRALQGYGVVEVTDHAALPIPRYLVGARLRATGRSERMMMIADDDREA